jgi:hypothetical protein
MSESKVELALDEECHQCYGCGAVYGESCTACRGTGVGYTVYVADEDAEPLASGSNKRNVLSKAWRECAKRGWKYVTLDGERHTIRRARNANEVRLEVRVAELEREIARLSAAVPNATNAAITAENVERFYKIWSACSGYRNPFGALRRAAAEFKQRLIEHMLALAVERSWPSGTKNGVLYIDTPEGQISWHKAGKAGGDKTYAGEWSGVRNSDQIIVRLLSGESAGRAVLENPEEAAS